MTETNLDPLYRPRPLLDGMVTVITAAVPVGTNVGVALTTVPPRTVNLWPSTPMMERLTMHGPTGARVMVQVTCVGEDFDDAGLLADLVRAAFGRTARGAFVNPITAVGVDVMDIEATDGHGDTSGGVATWAETYVILYQPTTNTPAVGS